MTPALSTGRWAVSGRSSSLAPEMTSARASSPKCAAIRSALGCGFWVARATAAPAARRSRSSCATPG